MKVDNSTTVAFANGQMKHKHSKAIDMHFHWVRDCVHQHQFRIYWQPGTDNLANYSTKHHPATHHQAMQPKVFHTQHLANVVISYLLKGCEKVRRNTTYVQSNPTRYKQTKLANASANGTKGPFTVKPIGISITTGALQTANTVCSCQA